MPPHIVLVLRITMYNVTTSSATRRPPPPQSRIGLLRSSMRISFQLALIWSSCTVAYSKDVTTDKSVINSEELKSLLKNRWETLESISFTAVEHISTLPGNSLDRTETYQFSWQMGGLAALIADRQRAGQTAIERFYDYREDGHRTYKVAHFKEPSKKPTPNALYVSSPKNHPDKYNGLMFRTLWAFMPKGYPVYRLLDYSKEITFNPRNQTIHVVSAFKDMILEGEFSLKYDGLPNWLKITPISADPQSSSHLEIHVNKFTQENDLWFPADGDAYNRRIQNGRHENTHITFHVQNLSINRGLPPERFQEPTVVPGERYVNLITNERKYIGSSEDRQKLLAARSKPKQQTNTIRIFIISLNVLVILGLAIVFVVRRRYYSRKGRESR